MLLKEAENCGAYCVIGYVNRALEVSVWMENKKISGRLATAQSKQHKVQYTFINNSGDRGFYQLLMKCP